MKNKLGRDLTGEAVKVMWDEAKVSAFHERSIDLLDDKACNVYYERMEWAGSRGASEEELDTIDAKDVTLTFGDRVKHWIGCVRLGSFLQTLHHWLTVDPCYYH